MFSEERVDDPYSLPVVVTMTPVKKWWAYTSTPVSSTEDPYRDNVHIIIMPCICDSRDEWIAARFRSFEDIGGDNGYLGAPIFARTLSDATNRALDAARSGGFVDATVFLVARLLSEQAWSRGKMTATTEDTYVYDSSAYVLSPRPVGGSHGNSSVLRSCLYARPDASNMSPAPQDVPVFIDADALRAFVRDGGSSLLT